MTIAASRETSFIINLLLEMAEISNFLESEYIDFYFENDRITFRKIGKIY